MAPDVTGGIVIDTAGTIYQVGTYNPGTTSSVGYLMAYSSDGTHANISPTGGLDTAASTVTLATADNKPVVIGTAVQHSGADKQTKIAVNRFYAVNPDSPVWVPDTTWGGAGLVTVTYNGPNANDSLTVGDLGQSAYEMPTATSSSAGSASTPGRPRPRSTSPALSAIRPSPSGSPRSPGTSSSTRTTTGRRIPPTAACPAGRVPRRQQQRHLRRRRGPGLL